MIECLLASVLFSALTALKPIIEAKLIWSLVKCGIAECGMRKVKCGIEKCGNGCGMVGKMRNAEKVGGVNLPLIQYLDHA